MKITAILCTYKRCHKLGDALESLAASVLPETDEWEILVVDNNSPDQTREVVEGFMRRYPGRFRYFFEPKQGKSNALNSGIREARGDVLAFVDDDVTVEKTWLKNLTANLGDDPWSGAGGKILPPPDFLPPEWLALEGPYNFGGVVCAQFDLGNTAGELKEPPYGTNMAFRKEVFKRYGTFRVDLGPRPGSELRNEDTEFGRRVLNGGERLRYEPSAVVFHPVPPERVRKEFLLTWWFDFGRAQMREKGKRSKVLGIPHYCFSLPNITFRHLPRWTLRWLTSRDPKQRFHHQCFTWATAGTLAEIWNRAKANPWE
jgi:glycosyltransferase involved in cell wall biosynthesis